MIIPQTSFFHAVLMVLFILGSCLAPFLGVIITPREQLTKGSK